MTAASASRSPTAAGALSAFLRGVERRALVVAELQAGNAARAEQALVAVMRAFAAVASDLPMAQWPPRFWALLAARQALRETPDAQWEPALQHLAGLSPMVRLALLLRIGAGLDEDTAARILDASVDDYQHALAEACPRDAAGRPDAAGWRALAEQVQQRIRDLPPQRLQELHQPSASAATGSAAPASWRAVQHKDERPAVRRRRPSRPRWRGPLILVASAVVVLAAALGWRHWSAPAADAAAPGSDAAVTVEPLEREAPKVAPAGIDPMASDDAAMLADPDFAQVADADLHAWFAAGGPLPVDESQARPSRPEPAAAGLETTAADE